ncbi:MAG: hypothetical protein HPY70_09865 [Firmicutes bacterium]|jgi:DNA-binding FadR family transcriptional regulator|nr:hypothetical protein [Bacillota bacterium]
MLEPLAAKLAAQRADHKDLHDFEKMFCSPYNIDNKNKK